jgi:lysophospholipase L1-like esterase
MPKALQTFSNQTIRLVVHTSIGGARLRIRLSNVYGTVPVVVGRAHAARRASGPAIEAGSDAAVTFSGKPSVTVPPGVAIVSDAVPFTVRPLSDIAISLFLPEKAPATTSHLLALQDNYVSRIPSDWTSQTQLPAATTVKSWPFLTGVDVDAPPRGGVVVAFGDSTVDGDGSTANMNHRLTDVLAERLQRDERTRRFGVVNTGIVGNRLLRNTPHDPPNDFGDFMGESGLGRVERDALEEPGAIAVIVRIGLNDIAFPGAVSSTTDSIAAAELIAGYRALVAAAHRRRVRIIGTTVTPFEQATLAPLFFTPAKDAVRQEVNTWIRSSGVFDAVIDADRILRDPTHITRLLPAFDSGDHLHTNDAGYAAVANAIPLSALVDR